MYMTVEKISEDQNTVWMDDGTVAVAINPDTHMCLHCCFRHLDCYDCKRFPCTPKTRKDKRRVVFTAHVMGYLAEDKLWPWAYGWSGTKSKAERGSLRWSDC